MARAPILRAEANSLPEKKTVAIAASGRGPSTKFPEGLILKSGTSGHPSQHRVLIPLAPARASARSPRLLKDRLPASPDSPDLSTEV